MNPDIHKTVAIVSDAIYPYNRGGKETRIHELSTRLARIGWNVHIYTMNWQQMAYERNGITYHAICPYIPLYSRNRRSIRQGIIFGFSCLKLLWARFDLADVDSMPYFPLYAMKLVCFLKRKPMVATWHEVWPKKYWQEYVGIVRGWIASGIEKTASKLPDRIISVSPQTTQRIRSVYGRTRNVHTIESGIDMARIAAIKPAPDRVDILFAGRLLSHKHVDILLRAFKILNQQPTTHNLQLGVMGDGPERRILASLTKELDIAKQVTFFGFMDRIEKVWAQMKSSGVFVLPSTREGFGLSVLEANACGIPVVTIQHAENYSRKLVTPGKNGEVSQLDPSQLAKTIQKVLMNHTKYAQEVRQFAQNYDWEKQVRAVEAVYKNLL